MNKLIRCIIAGTLVLLSAATLAGSFGGEKALSNASIGSQFPQVAYYKGIIHVVWVGYPAGAQSDIYYARSTNNGGNFSVPVNISNTPSEPDDRPQVSAGPNGVFIAWNTDNDTGLVKLARSIDSGGTFATLSTPIPDSGTNFYSRITDLFTDSLGRVHLAYYDNGDTGGVSGMIHHRMTCDGSNWGPDTAVTVRPIDGDVDNEEPRLGEASGKIYITFKSSRNGNPQGGWPPYSIQLQNGSVNANNCTVSWSYPARRIAAGMPYSLSGGYRPEIAGNGGSKVHLAWWDSTQGANVNYRQLSTANGLFSASSQISAFGVDHLEPGGVSSSAASTLGGFQAPPALASNGTSAFLAYQKNSVATAQGFENGPIYLRESTDDGASWGAEQSIAVSEQATTPRLAVSGSNVAIVWSGLFNGQTARVYFRLYALGSSSGGPSFGLQPNTHDFGNQAVGQPATTVLTLLNTGTAGNITGITSTGDFSITGGTCAVGPIAGGGSCTATVSFSPTALGLRNGTVSYATDAADSPSAASLSGTGVASGSRDANLSAVVTGYYETILGRSADLAGKLFWLDEATRVGNLGVDIKEVFYAMAMQFFSSTEYRARNTSNTQYLTDLYRTFFIRAPDQAGLDFWNNMLNSGMSRDAMLNNFLFSTEFSNQMISLFGQSSTRAEINMTIDLYRGILGVLPDSGGFNYWLGVLRQAQCQGPSAVTAMVNELSSAFINSQEYANRIRNNSDYVGDLYNAFLRRGGDLVGYLYWVGEINSGAQTRSQVRANFIPSAEFQSRVSAVIALGCFR